MEWMAETVERRGSPRAMWPEARSVVMLGMNYGPVTDPLATLAERQAGTISVYARNRDYHDVIKGRLKELAGLLARRTGAEVKDWYARLKSRPAFRTLLNDRVTGMPAQKGYTDLDF
jgi:epoxyqueuosine reductase